MFETMEIPLAAAEFAARNKYVNSDHAKQMMIS